ncbi:MAG TPA: hypothetical protein VGZ22_28770 [Isosphaeraceae bacterium]|jgi:hypothetical protein|nr:hypothetical protein [Isosphaeraceae bacterium]
MSITRESACLLALLGVAGLASADDQLVLRPKAVLSGKQVVGFDEDGVRLAGFAQPFGWDEVEGGKVSKDQARFDQLRHDLGDPLFEISRHLKKEEYRELLEPSQAMYPRFARRRSKTAYMVCQALMWARIANGQREAALEPYLRCVEILRDLKDRSIPGGRRLKYDATTGLSPELPLFWFDQAAARASWPRVRTEIQSMSEPVPPVAFLYGATLALAAGDAAGADAFLAKIDSPGKHISELVQIASAQRDILLGKARVMVASLETLTSSVMESNRPFARFTLAQARLAIPDEGSKRDGVLDLLYLPAAHADQPELAAAALYLAQKTLDELHDRGADALRAELLAKFPQTDFATRLKSERPTPETRPPKPDAPATPPTESRP